MGPDPSDDEEMHQKGDTKEKAGQNKITAQEKRVSSPQRDLTERGNQVPPSTSGTAGLREKFSGALKSQTSVDRLTILFERGEWKSSWIDRVECFRGGLVRITPSPGTMIPALCDKGAWKVIAFHGTTLEGAHGIVRDRRLKGNPLVYAAGVQEPKDSQQVLAFIRDRFLGHSHNECKFFVEVKMAGRMMRLTSGGVEAEERDILQRKVCAVTHMKTGSGVNRYASREDYVEIKAFWFQEQGGLEGIEQYEWFQM